MKKSLTFTETDSAHDRIYIAAATLKNFKGLGNVEIQLLRCGASQAEMEALRDRNLVSAPASDLPAEIRAGTTRDMALACLLEAFTKEEIEELVKYLDERYGEHISELVVCPLELPLPFGVGPLGQMPESESSGFINFDLAPDYPLGFKFKGFYELPK